MLTSHSVSENGDLIVAMDAQWAFHVFGDPYAYQGFIGDWTARSIADVALRHMNQERLIAWGTPEGRFSFRLHQGKKPQKTFHQQFEGCIQTNGTLCLASFHSLTMCAQFEEYRLPEPQDFCLQVDPGRYHVSVQQLFRWSGRGQFPRDDVSDKTSGDSSYHIVIRPARREPPAVKRRIPLASWMYAKVGE